MPKLAALTLLISAMLCVPSFAQSTGDLKQRQEQKRTDLSGAANMEVISSIVEIAPGEEMFLHLHHGIEAAYVIQDAKIEMPGKPPLELKTGASQLNLREVLHGGFKVVGDTALKLFTVHVVDKGRPLYDVKANK